MTGRPPTRWPHPSPGPTRGPDLRRISEQAPLERCLGSGRGGARRHRPHRPDAGSGNTRRRRPRRAATPPPLRPRARTTCPTPSPTPQAAERKDAVAKLVKGEATTKTINGNRVIEVKTKGKDAKTATPASRSTSTTRCNREEDIFTVLVDFGDQTNAGDRRHAGPGAQPDRRRRTAPGTATPTDDNSTYWVDGLQPRRTTRT